MPCGAPIFSGTGGCLSGSTFDATADFPPSGFPPECAPNLENTVWFSVEITDPNAVGFEVIINEITGQDFAIVIGTFLDCNGTFFSQALECGQNFPYEFGPITPGQIYYIMVGSSDANAGDFEICVNSADACFINDDCNTSESIPGLVEDGGFVCVEGCNLFATPYSGSSLCGLDGNPVVWYAFQAGATASALNLSLESDDISAPVVALLQGDCAGGLQLVATNNGDPCAQGSGGSTSASFDIDPNATYYIAVSGQNTAGGDFELCASLLGEQTPCVLNHFQRVTFRSNGGDLDGPFLPEEIVTICYTIDQFMPPPGECQWIQGVVPVFGNGWTVVPFNITGATLNGNNFPTSGIYNGEWNTYSDVLYNHTVPYLKVGDFDGNGSVDMCNSNYDPNCPGPGVTGGLTNGQCWQGGTTLPIGWFCANRTDPCPDAGHPDDDWGDGDGCFGIQGPWEFCLDVRVRPFPECETFNDLTVKFFPLTHGEVGIAQNASSSVCANDQPSTVVYQVCCVEDAEFTENYPPFCSPGTFAYTPEENGVDFWEWSVNLPDGVEGPQSGSGSAGTTVINTINNTGTATEIVEYIFQGFSGGNCPSVIKRVFVTVSPELVVNLEQFNACATPSTPYELIPDVTGGSSAIYDFSWFDGSGGSSLLIDDPDPNQSYSVTVTDQSGCTQEAAVMLDVYDAFLVDIDAPTQLQCMSDGPVDLNAIASDGTPDYVYEWTSPTGGTTPGASISVMESGEWSVVVTDSKGCTGQASVDVEFLESPTVTLTPDIAEICPNNPEPEQITATAEGGTPPYFFTWQTPIGPTDGEFVFAEALGTYIVEVVDDNGCITETSVDVSEAPYPNFDLGDDVTICVEELELGYDLEVPNDPSYLDYEWSNGATSPTINVTEEGLYTVTVTNLDGCIGTEEINLETFAPVGDVFDFDTATFCAGGFAELEGPADYIYEWSTGSFENPLIVVSTQTIMVTVTDDNNCTAEDVVEVIESASLLPNISGGTVICNGNAVDLMTTNFAVVEWYDNPALATPISTGNTVSVSDPGWYYVEVSDGNGCFGLDSVEVTEGDLQVSISGDDAVCDGQTATIDAGNWAGFDWSTGESTQTIDTDTAGLFMVTVTDASGCSGTASFQVDVSNSPDPNITGPQTFCSGGSTTLDAGGPYDTYEWSIGGSDQQVTVSSAAAVYLTVTNSEGCEGFDTVIVTESSQLMPVITGDSTVCNGVAVTIDAGSGFATYAWTGGSGGQTLSVTNPGIYEVTVTDASGCTGTDAIEVIESTTQVGITGDNALCQGETTTLMATAGFDSYEWSTTDNTPDISVSTTGSFSVTVTDAQGCTGVATYDVTVNSLPVANITGSTTFCTGGTTTLDAGSGFSQYQWSGGESSQTVDISLPGTVGVTVTDANGCTATDEIVISESSELSPMITGDSLICDNASATLNAGTGYATYAWSTGGMTQMVTVSTAGNYSVTVTDNSGCSGTDVFTVNSGSASVNITGDDIFCEGEMSTLTATTGFADYEWSTTELTETIDVTASGTYTVTVTDQVGCTGTAAIVVTANQNPNAQINGSTSFCVGGNTVLDAGAGFASYSWSTGSNNQTESVNTPGTVVVTVTDANGCTATDQVDIIESTELILNVNDTSLCAGQSLTLTVGSFDTYEWSTSAMTPTIDVTTGGAYSVTVTDVTGCSGSATINVAEVQPPSATVIDSVICNAASGGSQLNLRNLVTAGDMSGIWTDLDNSGATGTIPALDFDGVTPGVYRFEYRTASAQQPCTDQAYVISVQVLDCACPSPALSDPADMCDDNARLDLVDLFIGGVTAPGGTWAIVNDPGGANPATLTGSLFDATDADPGQYQLQYTLPNVPAGCPDSDVVDILVVESPDAGVANGTARICVGEDSTLVLSALIDNEGAGGIWNESSVVPSLSGFDPVAGTFTTELEVPGTYLFDYILVGQAPCPDAMTTVEIVIEDVPVAEAGPDQSITCDFPSVTIGAAGSSQGAAFSYLWTTTNGVVQTPAELFATIRDSGTYVLAVTNTATGCVSYDEVSVDVIGAVPTGVDYELTIPDCEGDPAAALEVLGVIGGTAPYTYSLNGSAPTTNVNFANLDPGEYLLSIEDNEGCKYETVFEVPDASYLDAAIAGDLNIQRGQTAVISYALSSGNVQTAEWTNSSGEVICANCDSIELEPIENYEVVLTLTDSNGCRIVLSTTLVVRINRDLFVPNVFSPNGDGVNDFVTVYGEPGLQIEELAVFSRWGELLFETSDVPAGAPEQGWNGKVAGEELMPGVYVFRASVRYLDGVEEIVIGDVTLVK